MLCRKLVLSFMFLKSQSFTVWSTEAVANNQSQRELNSACVTLALCNLSLKIYRNGETNLVYNHPFLHRGFGLQQMVNIVSFIFFTLLVNIR